MSDFKHIREQIARIKQAMCDGEHTDGDLEWSVDTMQALLDVAEAALDVRPGDYYDLDNAIAKLQEQNDD